jgi:hypothetical protein
MNSDLPVPCISPRKTGHGESASEGQSILTCFCPYIKIGERRAQTIAARIILYLLILTPQLILMNLVDSMNSALKNRKGIISYTKIAIIIIIFERIFQKISNIEGLQTSDKISDTFGYFGRFNAEL